MSSATFQPDIKPEAKVLMPAPPLPLLKQSSALMQTKTRASSPAGSNKRALSPSKSVPDLKRRKGEAVPNQTPSRDPRRRPTNPFPPSRGSGIARTPLSPAARALQPLEQRMSFARNNDDFRPGYRQQEHFSRNYQNNSWYDRRSPGYRDDPFHDNEHGRLRNYRR